MYAPACLLLAFLSFQCQLPLSHARTYTQCPNPVVEIPTRTTITYKCAPEVERNSANNYCFRDDVAAFRRESDDSTLHIISNGCPDHPYFQHGPLQTNFAVNGDSSCPLDHQGEASGGDCSANLTSSSEAVASSNPFFDYPNAPRYISYQLDLPSTPVVTNTVTWPTPGQPVGIAINGVLYFSDHTAESNSTTTRMVDNCAGHSDISHGYHYHSPPVCLLVAMSATVPATGANHLRELSDDAQVSHWPKHGEPSELLGMSMDGFPIYGPYNATGHLQVAGLSSLNECNFNVAEGRYYLTPNYPFVPSCFVGSPGTFRATQLGEGLCPLYGQDNVFCVGTGCAPSSVECFPGIKEFMISRYWIIFITLTCLLLLVLVWLHLEHRLYPNKVQYPYDKAICSTLPAYILILFAQQIIAFFYGTNYSFRDISVVEPTILTYLGTTAGSFLTVVGVVYGLLIAQIVGIVHEKFVTIRNALSEELASCQQVSVLIKSIAVKGDDDAEEKLKRDVNSIVLHYVRSIDEKWGLRDEDKKTTEILYGAMPMIHSLCGSVTVPLNIQIADRIIDSLNALSTAKHKRLTLEQESLPEMLWTVQYILSTIMFSGVLLINSGSLELNIYMCFATSLLIGINSLLIADMDMPYIGYIVINKKPLSELVRDMTEATQPTRSTRSGLADDNNAGGKGATTSLEDLARRVIANQMHVLTRVRSRLSFSDYDNHERRHSIGNELPRMQQDNRIHAEEEDNLFVTNTESFQPDDSFDKERIV